MIVDSMSYTEIRRWLFNNVPSDDTIMSYMEKTFFRACRKTKFKEGHMFNSIYERKIENVTYLITFSYKPGGISATVFATFMYKNAVQIVSLNRDRRIMWYTRHFRERIVERLGNVLSYSMNDFLRYATKMIMYNTKYPHSIRKGDTYHEYDSGIMVIDNRTTDVLFYITYIPNISDKGLLKRVIQSELNKKIL